MTIKFIDVPKQHQHMTDEILESFRAILEKGDFILGEAVRNFEQTFAKMVGAKHCLGVNSGTDALVLSLAALGIGPGDEVIVPAFTFIATADAVTRVGAKPVFVDVRKDTMNIDPEIIPEALTADTKAIIPVHLFGQICDIEMIRSIAESFELAVIEDAAQSCGAKLNGKHCGTLSNAGCFSFYPTKNLGGVGDGGCIVTDDDDFADLIRRLRDHGRKSDGSFDIIGFNSRLDSLQAAYLNLRMEEFEDSLLDRIENARFYSQKLERTNLNLPAFVENGSHSYNCYTMRLPRHRDLLSAYLREKGIGSAVYYAKPVPFEDCYQHLGYEPGDFPMAEEACASVLSLPIFPGLTKRELETTCAAITEFMEHRVTIVSTSAAQQ